LLGICGEQISFQDSLEAAECHLQHVPLSADEHPIQRTARFKVALEALTTSKVENALAIKEAVFPLSLVVAVDFRVPRANALQLTILKHPGEDIIIVCDYAMLPTQYPSRHSVASASFFIAVGCCYVWPIGPCKKIGEIN
jgi:hypothetical protein